MAAGRQALANHQTRLTEQQTILHDLRVWRVHLEQENQTNPDLPAWCEAWMDAGFTSGENLTGLIEMGYCPNTQVPNAQTTTALQARLTARTHWVRVGDNAEMIARTRREGDHAHCLWQRTTSHRRAERIASE